jgi:hypothetical protein
MFLLKLTQNALSFGQVPFRLRFVARLTGSKLGGSHYWENIILGAPFKLAIRLMQFDGFADFADANVEHLHQD